jgi:hypothetical protein
MTGADRVFRFLLRAYPPAFRAEYAREMTTLFRDRQRRDGVTGVRLWAETLWDVARSAPAQRLDAWRQSWTYDSRTVEDGMVKLGILGALTGAMLAVNASQEIWFDGWAPLYGALPVDAWAGMVAGILLFVAGIGLLRRTRAAVPFARGAAVICLIVFVTFGVVKPEMSFFATGTGILVPIAMLVALSRNPGERSSASIIA